uniref:Protein kinase domain-containing protein n=1 Tax=Ananas comosus var. bracteatus TaxID=296719 RepID=A0A6V7PQA9_ANACO|nr:unnamed protein product [Ananas comosus var. bracteatus]
MLLDIHRTLKIADFGVAWVEAQNPKDMTGEILAIWPQRYSFFFVSSILFCYGMLDLGKQICKPYNHRCDVYSFGICLWEVYCCDMPHPDLSFVDVSSAVVRQNLRPEIPRCCPNSLASIMRKCWDSNPDERPEMHEVVRLLEEINTSKGGGMILGGQAGRCFCFVSARAIVPFRNCYFQIHSQHTSWYKCDLNNSGVRKAFTVGKSG